MTWRPCGAGETVRVGDYPRYPSARLRVSCADCGWAKGYSPERIIDRLRQLKAGGYRTTLREIAARMRRSCPDCGRTDWHADFAWPAGMTETEIRRIASRYRS